MAIITIATRPDTMDPIQMQRLLLLIDAFAETIPDLSVSRSTLLSPELLLHLDIVINHI